MSIAPPITDAQARVRRGAALLDEHGPEDWRDRIDADNIEMNHCRRCIVGQVFGSFTAGMRVLGQPPARLYGFGVNPDTLDAWREELGA